MAFTACNRARNNRVGKGGFSPTQWVLGRGYRTPWSLTDQSDNLAAHCTMLDHSSPYYLRLQMLHDAEKGGEVGMAEPTIDLIARKKVALTTVRGARFDVGVPHEYVSSVAQLGGFRR